MLSSRLCTIFTRVQAVVGVKALSTTVRQLSMTNAPRSSYNSRGPPKGRNSRISQQGPRVALTPFPTTELVLDRDRVLAQLQNLPRNKANDLADHYLTVAKLLKDGGKTAGSRINTDLRDINNSLGFDCALWYFRSFQKYCNTAHWSRMLNLSNSATRYEVTEELFNDCIAAQIPLDDLILSVMVRCYCVTNRLHLAIEFVERMQQHGFKIDNSTTGMMLEVLSKHGSRFTIQKALALLSSLQNDPDFHLSDRSIADVANILSRFSLVSPLVELMMKHGNTTHGKQNTMLLLAVTQALNKMGDVAGSVRWMRYVEKTTGFAPAASFYGSMAHAFKHGGNLFLAATWLQHARIKSISNKASDWMSFDSWERGTKNLESTMKSNNQRFSELTIAEDESLTYDERDQSDNHDFSRFSGSFGLVPNNSLFTTPPARTVVNGSGDIVLMATSDTTRNVVNGRRPTRTLNKYPADISTNNIIYGIFLQSLCNSRMWSHAMTTLENNMKALGAPAVYNPLIVAMNDYSESSVGLSCAPKLPSVINTRSVANLSNYGYDSQLKFDVDGASTFDFKTMYKFAVHSETQIDPNLAAAFGDRYSSPAAPASLFTSFHAPRSSPTENIIARMQTWINLGQNNTIVYIPPPGVPGEKEELKVGVAIARHIAITELQSLPMDFLTKSKHISKVVFEINKLYAKFGLPREIEFLQEFVKSIPNSTEMVSFYREKCAALVNEEFNTVATTHYNTVMASAKTDAAARGQKDKNVDITKLDAKQFLEYTQGAQLVPATPFAASNDLHKRIFAVLNEIKQSKLPQARSELLCCTRVVEEFARVGDVQSTIFWLTIADKANQSFQSSISSKQDTGVHNLDNAKLARVKPFSNGQPAAKPKLDTPVVAAPEPIFFAPTNIYAPFLIATDNVLSHKSPIWPRNFTPINSLIDIMKDLPFPIVRTLNTVPIFSDNSQSSLHHITLMYHLFTALCVNPNTFKQACYMYLRLAALLERQTINDFTGKTMDDFSNSLFEGSQEFITTPCDIHGITAQLYRAGARAANDAGVRELYSNELAWLHDMFTSITNSQIKNTTMHPIADIVINQCKANKVSIENAAASIIQVALDGDEKRSSIAPLPKTDLPVTSHSYIHLTEFLADSMALFLSTFKPDDLPMLGRKRIDFDRAMSPSHLGCLQSQLVYEDDIINKARKLISERNHPSLRGTKSPKSSIMNKRLSHAVTFDAVPRDAVILPMEDPIANASFFNSRLSSQQIDDASNQSGFSYPLVFNLSSEQDNLVFAESPLVGSDPNARYYNAIEDISQRSSVVISSPVYWHDAVATLKHALEMIKDNPLADAKTTLEEARYNLFRELIPGITANSSSLRDRLTAFHDMIVTQAPSSGAEAFSAFTNKMNTNDTMVKQEFGKTIRVIVPALRNYFRNDDAALFKFETLAGKAHQFSVSDCEFGLLKQVETTKFQRTNDYSSRTFLTSAQYSQFVCILNDLLALEKSSTSS